MNFLSNEIVIQNLSNIIAAGFLSFIISFLAVPWVGKLAYSIQAIDLPAKMRKLNDRSRASRINEGIKPKLGGLAVLIAVFITVIIANPQFALNSEVFIRPAGIILGILVIGVVGFLDDKYEISGFYQLLGHALAAVVIIYFGIAIPDTINILGQSIDLNTYQRFFDFGSFEYLFVFPSHILTILWVVTIINFINWVGGVDGLNISFTSIIAFTMLLFALSTSNIPLAILISIHIGANLGLLPYNYYPSHIIPGGIGDYLNGYMIAVFALLGDTRWTITIIILALPVIDALIVIWGRMQTHPEVKKNPLKLLSISDTNHLHHRLMAAGYSRKTVLLIEVALISAICSVAVYFGINTSSADTADQLITAFAIAMALIIVIFTSVFVLKERKNRQRSQRQIVLPTQEKEAVVKVVLEEEDDNYERFAY
ncbi:undecaprenyl/decaprenyl-phosphate alpha-N-acetylglucosaminyl 1-phosphate transferase [Candidatus Dojkabacteria bacterium]|uniref:Undecaprenyl/decaprenyl-phosphate alpha-N-acetylglucosaminyl 1-phosphate transferase n=1 Tax=Candidatus Dojkabacteria bacterium TaxID=2099670 RepID=A0A955L1X4_9BACT|nr:undecaprenyl/decaprenyl-phosphate alpha-N-acetylglucosaminyl 1-phosphate transferase [Candidatus Dojkabacteria bacterium]